MPTLTHPSNYNLGAHPITKPSTFLKPGAADILVIQLARTETDGWTYTAVHAPNGKGSSYIAVRDETGEFLGVL